MSLEFLSLHLLSHLSTKYLPINDSVFFFAIHCYRVTTVNKILYFLLIFSFYSKCTLIKHCYKNYHFLCAIKIIIIHYLKNICLIWFFEINQKKSNYEHFGKECRLGGNSPSAVTILFKFIQQPSIKVQNQHKVNSLISLFFTENRLFEVT